MAVKPQAPGLPPEEHAVLPITPSDDDIDLNDEDTDTVDDHPIATHREPHTSPSKSA
jgi:hypothetical protein